MLDSEDSCYKQVKELKETMPKELKYENNVSPNIEYQ